MTKIKQLAEKYNLIVIEDCAEAIGSSWNKKLVGTFGEVSTFSFFGNKTISTGEGGMILFKSEEMRDRAKIFQSHGMSKATKYWHEVIGFNYRLTNVQAAIGVAQMENFSLILNKKIRIFDEYTKLLKNHKCIYKLPNQSEDRFNSNWLYTIILDRTINRDYVISSLLDRGIDTRPMFYPLHLMPPYKQFKRSKSINYSTTLTLSGISLPTSISLEENDIKFIVQNLLNILAHSQSKIS